ncbi:9496_t:CDS:1, partial [Gigaspora rosea]
NLARSEFYTSCRHISDMNSGISTNQRPFNNYPFDLSINGYIRKLRQEFLD